MAYEPSLGEITGKAADPELAGGAPVVNIDLSQGLKYVNDAAHAKAQNDWNKYSKHLEQVNQFAANHQLNFEGVMQEDIPAIEKEASRFWEKIAQDPKAITQIGQDQDWQKIQGLIAKSKQDNSLLALQEKFRDKNPELLNEKNNKIALDYRNAGLGRKAAQLNWDLPKTLDMGKLATAALTTAGGKTVDDIEKVMVPNEKGVPTYTGKYRQLSGTRYDKNKFDAAWNNILITGGKSDAFGHTVREAAQDTYNNLPKEAQDQFEKIAKQNNSSPLEEWWKESGKAYFKPEDITKGQLIEDKAFDQQAEYNRQLKLEQYKQGQENYRANLSKGKEGEAAAGLVRATKSIYENESGQEANIRTGNNAYSMEKVVNLDPETQKIFARTGEKKIIKDGKNTIDITTDYPDVVTKTKDGQLRATFFKRYETQKQVNEANAKLSKKLGAGKFTPVAINDIAMGDDDLPEYETSTVIPKPKLMLKIAAQSGEGKASLDVMENAASILEKEDGGKSKKIDLTGYKSGTAPNGKKVYSNDGGKTVIYEDGTPYK